MAARVAAIRRFLADSRQELHEVHRSRTPDRSRQNLPLLGHRVGRHRAAGNAWKVRLLKSLSRRWAKSVIANQSRLQHAFKLSGRGWKARRSHRPAHRNVPLRARTEGATAWVKERKRRKEKGTDS